MDFPLAGDSSSRRLHCAVGVSLDRPKECKVEECSPEQIKKCHGDVKEHPCVKRPGEK